jgi:hypothetical protein
MVFAGVFLWAAVTTNLFTSAIIAPLVFVWIALAWPDLKRAATRTILEAACCLLAGAAFLTIACGIVSVEHGRRFFFFMGQIEELRSVHLKPQKIAGYHWMIHEPRLLVPPFLILLLLAQLRRMRARWSEPGGRFAAGVVVYLSLVYAFYCTWEFAFGGIFFDIGYYFSYIDVSVVLGVSAAVYLAISRQPESRRHTWPAIAVTFVAAFVPMLSLASWATPRLLLSHQLTVALTAMLLAVVAVLAAGRPAFPPVVSLVGVASLTVLAVNVSAAASSTLQASVNADPAPSRAALNMSVDAVRFFARTGIQAHGPPSFWYDLSESTLPSDLNSFYLWAYTWIGTEMPKVDQTVHANLGWQHPQFLVIMCTRLGTCDKGEAALPQLDLRTRPFAKKLLRSGRYHEWMRVYEVLWRPGEAYYTSNEAALGPAPAPGAQRRWSLAAGVTPGWSGASIETSDRARGRPFSTSQRQWNYELVSPDVHLEPGSYAVYLKGTVLDGGLDLGVLDTASKEWVGQRMYWYGQDGFGKRWMVTPFHLDAARDIQVVLSNWVPGDQQSSRWRLSDLRLVRLGLR